MAGEPEIEELRALARRLDRNVHGHIRYALELKRLDDWATAINVLGGVIVLGISSALIGGLAPAPEIGIALAVVSGGISVIGVAQAVWKPGERAQRHRSWASTFLALENDCRGTLAGAGSKTLSTILAAQNALSDHVDLVPDPFWRRPAPSPDGAAVGGRP